MRKILFIFIGGFIGAVCRSFFYNISLKYFVAGFPMSTMTVNLIGCFLLSFISNLVIDNINIDKDVYIALTTGLIGAYTTFSTFSKDLVLLIADSRFDFTVIYLSISIIGGLLCVVAGYYLAMIISSIFFKKRN